VLTSADALDADFVAAGAAIPAQQPNLTDSATLTRTKIGVLAFATDELMQTWQPGTLSQLDNILQTAIRRGADRAVLDPDRTAISDERPASLLNGAAPLGSLNSDAAGALSDFEALIGAHIDAGSDLDRLLICLHPKTALRLCTMTNSNGDAAFPNLTPMGGSIFGVQVATTISAIRSGSPNEYVVAAIDGARVLLADDSEATLTVSKWATVEMSSTPTQSSTTPTPSEQVSMFQTDSVCIKLARTINFQACDSSAASWMTSTF
jgi:HK97 family phage major capsid protein